MNFCIEDIPAQVVCDAINGLVPNYHEDISNPEEALDKGEGNCFARMKLGGAALQLLGAGDDCYQATCDPDSILPSHGFLLLNPLLGDGNSLLTINSSRRGAYVYNNGYSPCHTDEDMRQRIQNGVFPITITDWKVTQLTRVSDIEYPELAMEAVSEALTEMGYILRSSF